MKPPPSLPATTELFRMDGMRVLLTGAGGAIGTVLAKAFADLGATVALHDLTKDKVAPLASAITESGGQAIALAADVSDPEQCASLIADAVEAMGGLDVLVNGAGINRRKPILDVTVDDFDAITAVNMRAVYLLSQAAHPHLKASNNGAIVNLSSLSARYSFNTISVYADEGGGLRNDPELRARMGARRHPRQLHRAGRGPDRVHQTTVGRRTPSALVRRHHPDRTPC